VLTEAVAINRDTTSRVLSTDAAWWQLDLVYFNMESYQAHSARRRLSVRQDGCRSSLGVARRCRSPGFDGGRRIGAGRAVRVLQVDTVGAQRDPKPAGQLTVAASQIAKLGEVTRSF
jgi:hypothetical protein